MLPEGGRRVKLGLVHDPMDLGMGGEIGEVGGDAAPLDLLERAAVADRRRQAVKHGAAELGQEHVEQRLLVGEVQVEGAVGDARLGGDAGDGGAGIAVAADDDAGGLDQAAARLGVLRHLPGAGRPAAGAARRRRGRGGGSGGRVRQALVP